MENELIQDFVLTMFPEVHPEMIRDGVYTPSSGAWQSGDGGGERLVEADWQQQQRQRWRLRR
eukprot:12420137-Karenia_brevis.AAC.1